MRWALLAAALSWSAESLAQQGEGAVSEVSTSGDGSARRVLVLVLPVDEAHASTADALTELLIGAVAASDGVTSIVGKEELQAQLQQSNEATLECIGSPPCLGRVGVQLGVSEVIAATLARRGSSWIFDLRRLNPRTGASTAQAFRDVEGDVGALADALLAELAAFDEPLDERARLRVAVDVPEASVWVDGDELGTYRGEPLHTELRPGAHRIVVRAQGYADWERRVELEPGETVRVEAGLTPRPATGEVTMGVVPTPPAPFEAASEDPPYRWSPLLWVGLSLGVASGAAALGFGISSRRDPPEGINRAEATAFVEDRQRDARVSNAMLGIALGSLGLAGLGLWLSGPEAPRSGHTGLAIALGVAPLPGGMALDWSGRW